MYVLVDPTGAKIFPETLCNSSETRQSYGCTAFPGDAAYEYPFDSSTVTLKMDGDTTSATDGSQQGYLHNVISQEMAEASPLSSYAAQAIAARTYADYETSGGTVTIDNSAGKQVYLPYRYEGLGGSQDRKIKVSNAVTLSAGLYMTLPGSNLDSIHAHYGQDNCTFTEDGVETYLESIYDPISAKDPGCQNSDYGTGYGGMSSAGASRWGYGNTDEYNNGTQWSVQWGELPEVISGESWKEAYRILSHYYIGIAIRNEFGQSLIPNYRWNPLIINWAETGTGEAPAMENGGIGTHNVDVALQNAGGYAWRHISDGGTAHWYLSYHWRKGSNVQEGSERVEIIQSGQPLTVLIGKHRTVTLGVHDPPDWGEGEYTLELDMLYELRDSGNIIWFNEEQSQEWFTYNMEVSGSGGGSGGQDEYVYLPLIIKSEPPSPAPTPTPSACTWVDNVLENRDFSDLSQPLNHWYVWIDESDGGKFQDRELYSGINYDPGNGIYGAFLGGENDIHQPDGGDNADQYLAQSVVINADEVEKIAIEYSYCLTTLEETPLELDKFTVDVQLGGLTGNSILPQTPEYNNLNAGSDCTEATGGANWRRRGEPVSEGGDGYLIVDGIDEQYSGDIELALVFYSDVNESRKTTFYFDSVKFKVCEK